MKLTLNIDIPDRDGTVRVEPEQRLKQWIKLGLRAFGIRVLSIKDSPETKEKANSSNADAREATRTTHGTTPASDAPECEPLSSENSVNSEIRNHLWDK